MQSLHKDTKDNFKAKRYMDDVLLFMKKEGWDATRFYEDFKRSECYMPPLRLEEANDGIFGKGSLLRNEPQYPTKGVCSGDKF